MKNATLKFEMKLDGLKEKLHKDLNPSLQEVRGARLKMERLGSKLATATASNEHHPDNIYEMATEILILNELINKGADLHGSSETTIS